MRGPQVRDQSRQLNEALSQNGEKVRKKHLPLDPSLNTRTKKHPPTVSHNPILKLKMRIFSNQYMIWGSEADLIEQQFYEEEWIEKEFGVLLGGPQMHKEKDIPSLC